MTTAVIGNQSALFRLLLLLAVLHFGPTGPESVPEQARDLIAAKKWEPAAEMLSEYLKRSSDDPLALQLYGKTLIQLDRKDEAAHYLEAAIAAYEEAGKDRLAKGVRRDLVRADKLQSRRDRMLRDISKKLFTAARALEDSGHLERALGILRRIEPISTGKDQGKIRDLLEKVQAAFEQVDLDDATVEKEAAGSWPLYTLESEHYEFECNLEPEVVQLVADTMDDIHSYYVLIYFDGDEKKARSAKATIRIYSDKQAMIANWSGGSAPEGWWSPGENKVTCYDTRTSTGTLDWMLTTLFHEASHQFMTLLNRGGGGAPAWLNEGTASFFEGAVAMADHRVLWPDAALPRLRNLSAMLQGGSGPSAEDVVSYSSPGSYPGNYYPFGWGLVYFMQQYEDPETLEYVFRPLYAKYREMITSKGGDSMELFEEVFLGKDSPLGHESFEDFVKDWRAWILEDVRPLHTSATKERRELRMAAIERYAAAAQLAAGNKKAPVREEELMKRALGHAEYVRTQLDSGEKPDLELHLLQADLLMRLDRPQSAAPLFELVLDFADDGLVELAPERYEEINERLKKLDSRNHALRSARSKVRGLSRTANKLVADYQSGDEPMLLRAYTFAALAGEALDDTEGLIAEAAVLRERAREAGLLLGQVRPLGTAKKGWTTAFSAEPKKFAVSPDEVLLESVRPIGFMNTSYRVGSEYEIRARLHRVGEVFMSSIYGVVVAATPDADWFVFGFGRDGRAGLWQIQRKAGGASTRRYETFHLDPPLGKDESPELILHVREQRFIDVTVGERETFTLELPENFIGGRHVGAFVKDGTLRLEDPVVELYP